MAPLNVYIKELATVSLGKAAEGKRKEVEMVTFKLCLQSYMRHAAGKTKTKWKKLADTKTNDKRKLIE